MYFPIRSGFHPKPTLQSLERIASIAETSVARLAGIYPAKSPTRAEKANAANGSHRGIKLMDVLDSAPIFMRSSDI